MPNDVSTNGAGGGGATNGAANGAAMSGATVDGAAVDGAAADGTAPSDAGAEGAAAPSGVRHRTERDASGRVWRFVYDPAAQDALGDGVVRLRCTTGTARATLVVAPDWHDWPRQRLLVELEAALQSARGHAGSAGALTPAQRPPDRALARRRLVRGVRGVAWNCVYDPALPGPTDAASDGSPDAPERVRVRCAAGRDRIELALDPAWHRLGDRQLAALIEQALDARQQQ